MTERRDDAPETALVVGYVAGVHGIRGAVRVHLHDPDSDALGPGRTLALRRDGQSVGTVVVVAAGPVPGKPSRRRVTLEGVTDRSGAEALRGCELLVERDELPPLADDEFYLADAVGLPVERERDGQVQALGRVVGLTSNGVQDLFEVQWREPGGRARTWLLPVLPQTIVEVTADHVRVDLPLGMLPEALEGDA